MQHLKLSGRFAWCVFLSCSGCVEINCGHGRSWFIVLSVFACAALAGAAIKICSLATSIGPEMLYDARSHGVCSSIDAC